MKTIRLTRTMTVDPGFGGTGWAYWRGQVAPITGVIRRRSARSLGIAHQVGAMMGEFITLLNIAEKLWGLQRIVIEGVSVYDTAKSQKAAKEGDLSKLAYLVGAYVGESVRRDLDVTIVEPHRWKGTMDDAAVDLRVRKALDDRRYGQHEREAVGIGLSMAKVL